jgi:hypothetical protein
VCVCVRGGGGAETLQRRSTSFPPPTQVASPPSPWTPLPPHTKRSKDVLEVLQRLSGGVAGNDDRRPHVAGGHVRARSQGNAAAAPSDDRPASAPQPAARAAAPHEVPVAASALPVNAVERLEQYKLATAGERRVKRICALVWVILLAHTAFTLVVSVDGWSLQGWGSGEASPDADATPSGGWWPIMTALPQLLHLAYMWAFAQRHIARAEAGLLDAWEEARLLHARLPGSTITVAEAGDWVAFLKQRSATSAPRWPGVVMGVLGMARLALPAILTVAGRGGWAAITSDPGGAALDAAKAVAVGGKYIVYRDKRG